MKIYSANLYSQKKTYAIVIGRFNEFIGTKLLEGCLDGLYRHGVAEDEVTLHWVPGAFEIPLIAQKCAQSHQYDAVICLGAVIRGATAHFEFVAAEVSKGIANVSLQTGVPVIFGVLTTETTEQAIERAGTKAGNKGFESAVSAIEMANLIGEMNG